VGKSGASWITQALLLAVGSISSAMPVIAAIFATVVASFFVAVNGLRKEMVVSPVAPCLHLPVCALAGMSGMS
jgi:ATP/ADP translocase